MTEILLEESGMCFGPFDVDDCFAIEQSPLYQRMRQGVKIAEMAVLRQAQGGLTVWIIEAKSSSPRPAGTDDAGRLDRFINEVSEKLDNALKITLASCLGRHGATRDLLPRNFITLDLAKVSFRLILVVKGHQPDWCAPLQDALHKALLPLVRTMGLSPTAVAVINDEHARKWGLISAPGNADETATVG
ncbi:hypothetical protein CCR95_09090 [Thiocystis minor]|uniref:hypothetical protein n=1 Tax=Thiocystis minor TaxID=61597 RepID=UPI00191138F9|nr:hypothetical protein [Thiocystis minor]MBK5964236.1 hypothetical protein [Thiocystis minor]